MRHLQTGHRDGGHRRDLWPVQQGHRVARQQGGGLAGLKVVRLHRKEIGPHGPKLVQRLPLGSLADGEHGDDRRRADPNAEQRQQGPLPDGPEIAERVGQQLGPQAKPSHSAQVGGPVPAGLVNARKVKHGHAVPLFCTTRRPTCGVCIGFFRRNRPWCDPKQAENSFDAARLRLLGLLALDLNTRIIPADRLTADPVRVALDSARALAFENRPDYLSQMIANEAAKIGLDVARNQRLWDLAVVAGVTVPGNGRTGWRATERLPSTKTDLRAGLQLSIPINNPAIEQQEVQAAIGLRQGEVQLDHLRAQVDAQVRDGVRDQEAAWRRYTLNRRARELAEQALTTETAKLRAGRSTNFQVVTFQDQLRTVESAELGALIAYLDSLVTLDRLLGTTLDTWRIPLNDSPP